MACGGLDLSPAPWCGTKGARSHGQSHRYTPANTKEKEMQWCLLLSFCCRPSLQPVSMLTLVSRDLGLVLCGDKEVCVSTKNKIMHMYTHKHEDFPGRTQIQLRTVVV